MKGIRVKPFALCLLTLAAWTVVLRPTTAEAQQIENVWEREGFADCVLRHMQGIGSNEAAKHVLRACNARTRAEQDRRDALDREVALRRMAEAELTKAKEQIKEQKVRIAELGERLNRALAQLVGERRYQNYRSLFLEKLDEVLGGGDGFERVGDRFVFLSEVLFAPGSAELGSEGEAELVKLGAVLREVSEGIPTEVDWILRVDGHTDMRLIRGGRYQDNWELSQARALSVVRYLVEEEGIPPHRLAAAGFGEHRPMVKGDSPEALARNRRMEFKLEIERK